jgi:hypothetical protein
MCEMGVSLAWIEIYGFIASKATGKQERFLQCRTVPLRSSYKQERFYNAELLCEEDILV